jgi:thioredoxin reductase (NADPH)
VALIIDKKSPAQDPDPVILQSETDFDVVIIGGGPGGLSAALWCAELGLAATILEKKGEYGGQLLSTFNGITNFLGRETASGREMCEHFLKQLYPLDINRKTNAEVAEIDLASRAVTLSDGTQITGRAIVIATGVRRRKLDVPGAVEFEGRGILASGVASKQDVSGRSVVIVGGGDAALENALILSEFAEHVTVVHRRSEFTARQSFVDRLTASPNVEVMLDSELCSIYGSTNVEGVEVKDLLSGSQRSIACENVLIRIGVVPDTEMLRGQVLVDGGGYIRIDHMCATNVLGVFAIGDVANPLSPTISTAVGNGATAIKAALTLIRGSHTV